MTIKKLSSVVLVFTIIFSLTTLAFATEPTAAVTTLDRADALYELGLFAGTDKGYDLESVPNRTQAVIFLLRMLGEEKAAQNSSYTCPFTDVPTWAYKYVSYAYAKGYTTGTSKTTFGTNDVATPEQFVTFMLRALGYNDRAGEFSLSTAINKAEELNIIPTGKYQTGAKKFYRGDCIDIMYSVLSTKMNGSDITLAEKLIESGAIDNTLAAKYGFGKTQEKPESLIDFSDKVFTNEFRLSFVSANDLNNRNKSSIRCEIAPTKQGTKASNVYLSEDGINFKKLRMSSVWEQSNTEEIYVQTEGVYSIIQNLECDTTYTICIEVTPDVFIKPLTIRTPIANAYPLSGYGAPYGSKSSDGIYIFFRVGINLEIDGDWSYQFYRWAPGSDPVAIPGASGTVYGSAKVDYEPTKDDLNKYVFWRVTSEEGIIIETGGVFVEYITGMPVKPGSY